MNTDSKGNTYIDVAGVRVTKVPKRSHEPEKDWSHSDVIRIQDYKDDGRKLKPGPEIPRAEIKALIAALKQLS